MALDEACIDTPGHEIGMRSGAGQKGGIGPDWPDLHPGGGGRETCRCLGPRRSTHDQLGDHWVIVGRDLVILLDAAIDPYALREAKPVQAADGRQEPGGGIFGVEPGLHRPALNRERILCQRQPLAGSDAELPLDEVLAGDRLRHRMLDLQPGIHFHEPNPVGPKSVCTVGDEFDRAGADIFHGLSRADRRHADGLARLGVHARCWRFLDYLLVAALQRAVALEQMHDIAVSVAEHLNFDVARRENIFLDQHAVVAKSRCGLAPAAFQRAVEVRLGIDPAHALAATTGHCLDQHGIADHGSLAAQARRRLVIPHIAGRDWHTGRDHPLLGRILKAHRTDRGGRGTDPDKTRRNHRLGEFGVLRQEAIARMDRLRPRLPRCREDALLAQIAVPWQGGSNEHRTVRLAHEGLRGIGVGMDRDRADTEPPRGAYNPARDLATVRDEQTAEHAIVLLPPEQPYIRNRPKCGLSGIGAFRVAEKARPSTSRVWIGSITPSSQSRAVA